MLCSHRALRALLATLYQHVVYWPMARCAGLGPIHLVLTQIVLILWAISCKYHVFPGPNLLFTDLICGLFSSTNGLYYLLFTYFNLLFTYWNECYFLDLSHGKTSFYKWYHGPLFRDIISDCIAPKAMYNGLAGRYTGPYGPEYCGDIGANSSYFWT